MEFTLFKNGANWVKADFHLHSPYVHSFTLPNGINLDNELDRLVDLYLNKLIEKEIRIAAITDYQQVRKEFLKKLQTKAREKEIYILPGIELSVNYGKGLHILIIFEYDQDINGINDYIKSLDQKPHEALINDDRSHRDINLQRDLKIILEQIKSNFNCLIIYPHPNNKNGINSIQPKEYAELLKFADAIEFIDENDKNKLISTGSLEKSFFDNFAIIENTDPKSIDEIGSKQRNGKIRTTYLKLSSVSINAIKLALHDPALRVSAHEKRDKKNDRIISVKINGTSFLKNVSLDFNQDLNTLIGGRGVGKSAILEAIRYCLNLPVYTDEEYREHFVKSVVGSGGTIEIEIERFFGETSIKDKIKRVIGQLTVVEGKNLSPEELFADKIPLILGQKELYALSLKEDFQLLLIDNLIGEAIKKEDLELKKLITTLEENSRELSLEKKKIQKKDEYEQELKTINEHIKIFQNLGVADKMAKHTALIQDEKILINAIDEIRKKINELKQSLENTIQEIEKHNKLLQYGNSVEKNILLESSNEFLGIKEYFKNLKKDFENQTENYEQKINALQKKWQEQKKKYEIEINTIKQELSEKRLEPDKYESLIKRKTQLEPILNEYSKITQKIKDLETKRNELKNKIKEQRHNLFNIRKAKLDELNKKLNNRLKIDIEYLNSKEKFKEQFSELVRGSGISRDAINSITEKEAIDGIEISKYISLGEQKLKEKFGLTDTMVQRLLEWFKDDERLFKLETLLPDDKILIKLKVEDTDKELSTLSAGQKATALLILLFAQENRILVIDQPEEDLDNRFIYEDVVKILREIKNNRQIILVTHNANIPVLGDAEQVFVLEASNNECSIIDTGSIDKTFIVQSIKSIMEGGEEAFIRRIEKYGVKI
jgi:ABC-type cobalamin/Fe3+-siderophores transport system ATPase subunit